MAQDLRRSRSPVALTDTILDLPELVRPTIGTLLSVCKAPALGHWWKQQVVLNESIMVEARPYER